jgi:uncharacterized protein YbjT (DUF2867 family)
MPTIAAIGCSGAIAEPVIRGFIDQGATVRLLARNTDTASRRYPGVEVMAGSMSEPDDVTRVVRDADTAFLMTPMGLRDNPEPEVAIARKVLEGARAGGLSHLVYTSVLGADERRGVGILDATYEIERLIRESGIPFTILRCSTRAASCFPSTGSGASATPASETFRASPWNC